MFAAARFEPSFAAVQGLQITLPPERRVQLAALVEPGLTAAAYHTLDLPVVIGTMGEQHKQHFAPDLALGHFYIRNQEIKLNLIAGGETQAADDLVRANLFRTDGVEAIRRREQHTILTPPLRKAIVTKLLAQRPLVADILRFDRETFGDGRVRATYDFEQDRPGPKYGLAPSWHCDVGFAYHNAAHQMTRVYVVRSAAPTEIFPDRLAYGQDGKPTALLREVTRHKTNSVAGYAQWLNQPEVFTPFQAPPYAVALMTADRTWHKSHRPAQPVEDSFMRLVIRPTPAPGQP